MTETGDLRRVDRERALILDTAVAELAARNLSGFSLEGVAARAGLPEIAVKQIWQNTPQLLNAALMAFGERHMPVPDTGTLRGDLLQYARSYADSVNTPTGRRLMEALLIRKSDWDPADCRAAFLAGRHNRMAVVIERGIGRGECRPDTDANRLIDLLAACLCTPVMFYDRPISDADCEAVVDTLLNGIAVPKLP